jgi:hypothetical protein
VVLGGRKLLPGAARALRAMRRLRAHDKSRFNFQFASRPARIRLHVYPFEWGFRLGCEYWSLNSGRCQRRL